MKLTGTLDISRIHGDIDVIRIRVKDTTSRLTIIEAEMSLEGFAAAVTGLAGQECSIDYNENTNIGKVRYRKAVLVPKPSMNPHGMSEDEITEHLKPHETDGWKAFRYDLTHLNNWRPDGVLVEFVRWVDAEFEDNV
jgi:hypothetical protein